MREGELLLCPGSSQKNVAGAGHRLQLRDLHPVSSPTVSSLVVLHLGICGTTPREGSPFEATAVMEKGSRHRVLAAFQGLVLVWSECSLLHLLLWDAGHLAGPLLPMWASRSFPNTKSRILGGVYASGEFN